MIVEKSVFDAWKRRPPAFLVHIEYLDGLQSGSGVQVDAHHVLTCAHVFGRRDSGENFYASGGRLTDVTRRRATIRSWRFQSEGIVVAQHHTLDLVLVRLGTPRPGVAWPAVVADDSYRGRACVAGVSYVDGRLESLQQFILIEADSASQGLMSTSFKFEHGPREGTSGGGVFAVRDRGLLLIGIAQLGGETAWMGGAIAGGAVLGFLQEKIGFKNPRPPASDAEIDLAGLRGIRSSREFEIDGSPLKLAFTAVWPEQGSSVGPVALISRRVISAEEMRLKTHQRVLPAHRRLAAWAGKIAQAEAAVERLEEMLQLGLRLPTLEELALVQRSQVPVRGVQGRPLTLSDFKANERQIELPPEGTYEWARGRSGLAYAVELGADRAAVPEHRVEGLEPCFRVAFDGEAI
jgi:hypothetical protein